jgi:hypothetical protein
MKEIQSILNFNNFS